MVLDPQIEKSWKTALQSEFRAAYFQDLKAFLQAEKSQGPVYPPGKQIFAAFDLCPFDEVKGVIIGQDPYHGPGQAHGLSFSVQEGQALPPSLRNIFKELQSDLKLPFPTQGDLRPWAKHGLLLLNAVLTVSHKSPGSHRGAGLRALLPMPLLRAYLQREIIW
jgi:Uracil DNA glycosylase